MKYRSTPVTPSAHNLYRNVMAWNAASKPAVGNAQVLLTNIVPNPGGTACFTYQSAVVGVKRRHGRRDYAHRPDAGSWIRSPSSSDWKTRRS